jgi:hypothetical protein
LLEKTNNKLLEKTNNNRLLIDLSKKCQVNISYGRSVLLPRAPDFMTKLLLPPIKQRSRYRKNQIGTDDLSEKSL